MGLIKGQMFGDIRGKVAGIVFTRTKSGKMVRARVQPTDAKSAAQVSTRSLFSQSMSLWNTLTSSVKRQWNSYAGTIFRSKSHKKGSTATGSQAFASSNFVLNMANSHMRVSVFSPTSIVGTLATLASSIVAPPLKKFSSFLSNTALDSIPIQLKSGTLAISTGILTVNFAFPNGAPGAGIAFKNDSASDPFSLSFYLTKSNQESYIGQVLKGSYLLANTGAISSVTGLDAVTVFAIKSTVPAAYFDMLKNVFPAGSQAYLHCFAVSSDGQISKIGTAICTVSA